MKIDLSIITPVHEKAPFLRGFLYSLIEQDIWERMEVILVENGSKDDSWQVMNDLYNKLSKQNKEHVKLLQIKEANACTARNEGAKIAQGRYWSFLPADAALFPDAARTWVESLDEFPEYGFLYGGYRFGPPHGGAYVSEKYDLEMLKQYNFIDGSFPLKREIFPWFNNGGWDPTVKSLQDWDFWLAVVLGENKTGSGIKGLYRPEIFFETIPPQKGGLSDDSHTHWLERTKYIKDKWGIKEGEICVTSPGAPFHAKNVAKILGQEFRHAPQMKQHKFKMIYEIGFYPQLAKQCAAVFQDPKTNGLFNGVKVVHWVGSDIWGLLNSSYLNVKQLKDLFESNNFIHLTEFEQTRLELQDLGIEARVVPLPPARLYEPVPLPKKFTVAVYMPDQNAEFYYKDLMTEVAHMLPDIDFAFFGNRFDQTKNKNIQNMGYIDDMEGFIKECSAIVRLTIHDGLPISLVEFVTAGRNALFNIQMPHMMHVNSSNKELLVQRIKDLQKLPLNEEGSKYYRELMDHEKYRKTITALLKETGYRPKEYWNARAQSWEQQAKHGEFPHAFEIKKMLKGIEYKSVLDVGCGNGRWYPYFKDKTYKGIDISDRLIGIAKGFYPPGDFSATKIEDYDGGKVDLAFVYTCLQHVKTDDLKKAADKLKSIAKYILLIESQDFISADYCIDHDYTKYFNIVKKMKAQQAEDNPNGTLRLMLIKGGE